MKKVLIILLLGIILGFIIGQLYNLNSLEKQILNIPSKCYTDLQPSSYFKDISHSLISTFKDGSIKIEPKNKDKLNYIYIQKTNTNSMSPTITENSFIIYTEDISILNKGDIISFNHKGTLYLHRIIQKEQDEFGMYYITKGDNNQKNDGLKVRKLDIEYKVVGVLY